MSPSYAAAAAGPSSTAVSPTASVASPARVTSGAVADRGPDPDQARENGRETGAGGPRREGPGAATAAPPRTSATGAPYRSTAARAADRARRVLESIGVAAAVALAGLVGGRAILQGLGSLSQVNQDWDSAFHANGIRYIAETGDGSLTGMASLNFYAGVDPQYYPNAMHLVSAVALRLSGGTVPQVLNGQMVLLPGMVALGVAALVLAAGLGPLPASLSALVSTMPTNLPYDLIPRGPLLPFATGVVLIPAFVAVLLVSLRRRPALAALGVAAAACFGLHPSVLVSAVLFAVPALVQSWWTRPRAAVRDLAGLVAAAVLTLVVLAPHLVALTRLPQGIVVDWPAELPPGLAVGDYLAFSHRLAEPQWWLGAALVLGLLSLHRFGPLRWVSVPLVIFGVLFVASAGYDTGWSLTLTGIWWNDPYRPLALGTLAMVPVMGIGLATLAGALAAPLRRLPGVPAAAARAVAGVAVAALMWTLTDDGYIDINRQRIAEVSTDGPVVSSAEVEAYGVLASLVGEDELVMNNRRDGSPWMYALAGVRPVGAHYDGRGVSRSVRYLEDHIDDYDTDPRVRELLDEFGIRYVISGQGNAHGLRSFRGFRDLDAVQGLAEVYRNADAVIYERRPGSGGLTPLSTGAVSCTGDPVTRRTRHSAT